MKWSMMVLFGSVLWCKYKCTVFKLNGSCVRVCVCVRIITESVYFMYLYDHKLFATKQIIFWNPLKHNEVTIFIFQMLHLIYIMRLLKIAESQFPFLSHFSLEIWMRIYMGASNRKLNFTNIIRWTICMMADDWRKIAKVKWNVSDSVS